VPRRGGRVNRSVEVAPHFSGVSQDGAGRLVVNGDAGEGACRAQQLTSVLSRVRSMPQLIVVIALGI
jgi:hypothetical protein